LPYLPVTAAQHGYGISVAQTLTAAKADNAELTTQLLAAIAALQGQIAKTAAAAHGPPAAHLAQGGSIPRASRSKAYCFVHGHRGHTGATCRTMAADKTYTAAHKAATAPNEAYLNGSGGHPGRTALKKTN
jgi:hypothetical protein